MVCRLSESLGAGAEVVFNHGDYNKDQQTTSDEEARGFLGTPILGHRLMFGLN